MREYVLRLLGDLTNSMNETEPLSDASEDAVASGIFVGVTSREKVMDLFFGFTFLITAIFAAKRMSWTRQQGRAETTVVTAFYSLILLTSVCRSIWFLIPAPVWTPSYTPVAIFAYDESHPAWLGAFLSEFVQTAGSLSLFSIFILILVYWADILKKYFHPASRRTIPMVTFLGLVSLLVVIEIANVVGFFFKIYTTEGMILFNSVLLAVVSIVCVCEITIFSHRFQTVLKTLGAINQVSTDSQVKRIVWITVTGNLFFVTRAALETVFCGYVFLYWKEEHTVARAFSHPWWDTYVAIKFFSEETILSLMLYILQSRFATSDNSIASNDSNDSNSRPTGYVSVPNNDEGANSGSIGVQAINV